jgi:dipeptidyl-peptidase 4
MMQQSMTVLRRAVPTFLLLALLAPAQQPASLTLATVIERGPALVATLPQVLWLPGGHDATVVLTAADGNQTMHRLADGKLVEEGFLAATALHKALGAEVPAPAKFPTCAWHDATTLRIDDGNKVSLWQLGQERAATQLSWPEPDHGDSPTVAIAPGLAHVAFVRNHQLWLGDHEGRVRQLTFDGSADLVYGGAAHRAEFGIDRGLFWSKDGRYLAFSREDQRPIDLYPYQDLAPVPPTPVHGRYPMAGRADSRVRLCVCDTQDASLHWIEADPDEDIYWTNVTFDNEGHLITARVDRGQNHLELVRYDSQTGKRLAVLLTEHDSKWIEPEHSPTFLPDGRFLWWSAQQGHRHLWLHDADGKVVQQVTKGAFDVQKLCSVSADGKSIYYQASGEDPRQLHLFAANLDGTEVRQITREHGTHTAELSPDEHMAFVVWSNLETRPTARLLDLQTSTAIPLPQPADPLATFALPTQRLFQIKAEDDTVLYGHVALPPNLAEGQKCPVLLYVYGGPHVQLVTDSWFGGAPLWLQAFAAEGYVVCRLDNRGTPNRGIAFEQSIYRQLGTLEVKDQLNAVEWLKQQPFVDASRIGVHGWSFGGYMTLRLMLLAPETFACGVSGAPVTDWAMYETGYGERYMDTPAENADGYEKSSCLPLAGKLQRPLLLVQGTDDKTVMWSHTLDFVDRCIDAGVQLDYFVYPGQTHRLMGKDRVHFLKLLHDWLGRHLMPGPK